MAIEWMEWTLMGVLLIFPVVWSLSHSLRYYVKIVIYNALVVSLSSAVIPFTAFRPKNVDNIWYICWLLNNTLSIFGISLDVRNIENLKYDHPCVFVCNHQSSLDVITMAQIFPPQTTVLAKKELLYTGPFGISMWLAGVVFVDRGNHTKAHETMQQTAKIMHDRQLKIWIFPEGTRNFDGHLLPFKKGAFRLAIEAKVPVIPIVISSYQDFLCKRRKIFNRGKVIVSCLPAISTDDLMLDDVGSLTENTYKIMTDVYKVISKEVHEESVRNGRSIMIPLAQ